MVNPNRPFEKIQQESVSSIGNGRPGSNRHKRFQFTVIAILGIILLSAAVYYPVTGFDFIDLDDDGYVFQNEQVGRGLTLEGAAYALQTFEMANWTPVTWLSYMVDAELFGIAPGAFHRSNAVIHLLNALMLFWFLLQATSRLGASAFVAAMFAVHPLHVESVAWISERKDVLSTFFWLLCNLMYLKYHRNPGWLKYAGVTLFFILGLAAKPMLVTLPLGRMAASRPGSNYPAPKRSAPGFLLSEKVPLLIISFVFGVITLIAQNSVAAVQSLDRLPLASRVANALVSYTGYLGKMVWPADLAVLYPYPEHLSSLSVGLSLLLLVTISAMALMFRKQLPYIMFGWLWYLVTLLPVIGIIQAGNQAMADRYTYVPLIGIYIVMAWGMPDLLRKLKIADRRLIPFGAAVVVALALVASKQVQYWRNSVTLFSHTVAVTADNYLAYNSLGLGYEKQGRLETAIHNYSEAVRVNPQSTLARYNLGTAYLHTGRFTEAKNQYEQVLKINPHDPETLNNLAKVMAQTGRLDQALVYFQRLLQAVPDHPGFLSNMGVALVMNGQFEAAEKAFRESLRSDPTHLNALYHLGYLQERQGNLLSADRYYTATLRQDPRHKAALGGRERVGQLLEQDFRRPGQKE